MADPKLTEAISARQAKNDGVAVNFAHALDWVPTLQSSVAANRNDVALTVPAAKDWMFQSARVTYTPTTGTTGARQPELQFRDASDVVLFSMKAGVTVSEGAARTYVFGPGLPDLTAFRDTDFCSTPVVPMLLSAGFDVRLLDSNDLSTADDMTVRLTVLERDSLTT